MISPPLERPPRPDSEAGGENPLAGCFAVLFVLAVGVAVTALLSLFSVPLAVCFVAIFGGSSALFGFHYFVWGWWLGRMIEDDAAEEAAEGAVQTSESFGSPPQPIADPLADESQVICQPPPSGPF